MRHRTALSLKECPKREYTQPKQDIIEIPLRGEKNDVLKFESIKCEFTIPGYPNQLQTLLYSSGFNPPIWTLIRGERNRSVKAPFKPLEERQNSCVAADFWPFLNPFGNSLQITGRFRGHTLCLSRRHSIIKAGLNSAIKLNRRCGLWRSLACDQAAFPSQAFGLSRRASQGLSSRGPSNGFQPHKR